MITSLAAKNTTLPDLNSRKLRVAVAELQVVIKTASNRNLILHQNNYATSQRQTLIEKYEKATEALMQEEGARMIAEDENIQSIICEHDEVAVQLNALLNEIDRLKAFHLMDTPCPERLARIAERYNAPVDALKHLKPPFIRKNTGGLSGFNIFQKRPFDSDGAIWREMDKGARKLYEDKAQMLNGEMIGTQKSMRDRDECGIESICFLVPSKTDGVIKPYKDGYGFAQIAHNAVDTNVASVPSFATPSSSATTTATTTIIPSTTTTTATNHSVPAPSLHRNEKDMWDTIFGLYRQAVQQFYGIHIDDNAHMPWKDEWMYEDIVMEGWPDIPRDHPSRLSRHAKFELAGCLNNIRFVLAPRQQQQQQQE
ncbi:hypothetical protein BDB00DRAFT_838442 [Zychaea mexicana]|uniref:uncharacterized protein n=1 Tax=Zychaea mexicana TaxID=64656 RepID=UPI0022FEEA3E|nr:uncharacterized protein BDB00DRAFT_838442 [Zychaea mexicana]KAI9490272.1 hypothetical protein BDB00DRAFT_838442 [Zychaea mexicana]